jgi:predicted short-subunit dehydrogenase-like oxidoreductase (DUF2520 family)
LGATDQPALGFVGAGRAGTALSLAFAQAGYPVTAVYSRTAEHARRVAAHTGATVCASPADAARFSDVLFLTVPDDAIVAVTHRIAAAGGFRRGGAVVHASGALSAEVLGEAAQHGTLTGVFHPLQALSGASSVRLLRGAYVGIEAAPELLPVLCAMAENLGAHPLEIDPGSRAPYHIAAVLAANYTLVLLSAASELMKAAGVTKECALEALLPLVRGSLANLQERGPREGLTGPVVRGDAATVAAHMQYLRQHRPELLEAYRQLGLLALEIVGESFSRHGVRQELLR